MTERPKRTLRLDLTELAQLSRRLMEPTPSEIRLAKQASHLIDSLHSASYGYSARELAAIPSEVWDAAHAIAEGGMGNPALRLAAEEVDESAFDRLAATMARVVGSPEPTIGDEFI